MKKIIALWIAIIPCAVMSKDVRVESKKIQVDEGNFALSTSQQPGPLLGFGQNIVDKGDFQIFTYPYYLKGHNKKFNEITPIILYGITDKLSMFIEFPITLMFKNGPLEYRGVQDIPIQLEYAFYTQEEKTTADQLTVVGNITLPIGSVLKAPPTRFGSLSFFLGLTACHTRIDWYYFTSIGGTLTTTRTGTKIGNQFLYEFGISKNLAYKGNEWIFNGMIEFNGIYQGRNTTKNILNVNSGRHQIFLGPSLWLSTKRFILQGGISCPIYQHMLGNENKDKYLIAFDICWKL